MNTRTTRRNALNKTAVLLFALGLLLSPFGVSALQERTITDEPSVAKPAAPPAAQPAPAEPAPPTKNPFAADQPPAAKPGGYQPSEPAPSASGGSWTPPAPAASSGAAVQGGTAPKAGTESPKATDTQEPKPGQTYSRSEIDREVIGFFEGGAKGLADVVEKAFEKQGQPSGFIKGGEGAGALVVGFRYGEGWLHLKNGKKAYVYWQSPSIGFDLGVNASKVFCLVYNMTDPEQIYQRYPGIDGSAYVVGGFGLNYQRSGNITLAPIRFGVGLRLGANVGYMHFTRERTINPF
jgi:hypothetical protein